MPKMTTSSPVVKKSVSVSAEAWTRIEKLIDITGFSEAEQLRRLLMAGLTVEEEQASKQLDYEHKQLQIENRKLVNRKLKMREGSMARLINEVFNCIDGDLMDTDTYANFYEKIQQLKTHLID